VNVSRPTHDSGLFATGIVTRIYPTTVEITWPPDSSHSAGWTTEEKKAHLIFIRNNPDWKETVNEWHGKETYNTESAKPPSWTQLVSPVAGYVVRDTPTPFSRDVRVPTQKIVEDNEVLMYGGIGSQHIEDYGFDALAVTNVIVGYDPYTGLVREKSLSSGVMSSE
jgi:hypothetical protein